ncbi:hypothetical protein ADUPG1_007800 [Aduncisulcus paluster]|uniref:Uncharacterized protein n=1 Tax=Aduncisulcus paluster TaxID=2918883 RepID=A0ABQ5KPK3_9EUKA|nr:hypothetical protein ADUPG1_007800 [Aduncisulcus paluster]
MSKMLGEFRNIIRRIFSLGSDDLFDLSTSSWKRGQAEQYWAIQQLSGFTDDQIREHVDAVLKLYKQIIVKIDEIPDITPVKEVEKIFHHISEETAKVEAELKRDYGFSGNIIDQLKILQAKNLEIQLYSDIL